MSKHPEWFDDYLAAWSGGDTDRLVAFFAPNAVYRDFGAKLKWEGRESVREMIQATFDANADFVMRCVGGLESPGHYAIEWHCVFKHGGKEYTNRMVSTGTLDDQGLILVNHDYGYNYDDFPAPDDNDQSRSDLKRKWGLPPEDELVTET